VLLPFAAARVEEEGVVCRLAEWGVVGMDTINWGTDIERLVI